MGARFGSPTNRFGSGTLEEFSRAYDKSKRDKGATKIMMYFKNVPLLLNEIDTDQIKKVQDFKKILGQDKGGLYWDYNKASDFRDLVRNHLNLILPRLADEYKQENASLLPEKKSEVIEEIIVYTPEEVEEVEEQGYLDSLVIITDYFSKIKSSAGRITVFMVDMTNKMARGTEKINKIKHLSEQARIREARKIIDKTADDIMVFVNKTNAEIPIYRDAVTKGFNAYSNAYVNYHFFASDDDELLELEASKNLLRESINSGMISLIDLKETISQLPGMTAKLVKAKKEYIRTINRLISEFELSLRLLDDTDNKE